MATKDRSGWKAARFCTTAGFSTSVPIPNVLNGTDYDGEHDVEADGQGRDASAGFGIRGVIRSSAVTASWVSTMEGYHNLCTEIYVRLVSKSSKTHTIGPVSVMLAAEGPGSGSFNAKRVNFHGTGEKESDLLTIT